MQTPLMGDYDQNIGISVTKFDHHTSQTALTATSVSQAGREIMTKTGYNL
jgi:hypothetical protein